MHSEESEGGKGEERLLLFLCVSVSTCVLASPKCVQLCVHVRQHLSETHYCKLVNRKVCGLLVVCGCVSECDKEMDSYISSWLHFPGAFFNGFVFRCWVAPSYIFHDILCSSCYTRAARQHRSCSRRRAEKFHLSLYLLGLSVFSVAVCLSPVVCLLCCSVQNI